MAVLASAAPAVITDDPHAIKQVNVGPLNAAVLVASTNNVFFTTPADDYYDIIAIYASLQVVAAGAAQLTLYKQPSAGVLSAGTALMSASTLTATDYTAGTLHDLAEKLTAATLLGLAPNTQIGAVMNATATTGLVGMCFTFVLRKSGYRTTANGGKFYPVPSPNNF